LALSKGKSQVQWVLDVLVYAPAGLAQSAAEELEKLAGKGRHRVEGQVHTARLVGQFAVQTARSQAEQAIQAAAARWSRGGGAPGYTASPGEAAGAEARVGEPDHEIHEERGKSPREGLTTNGNDSATTSVLAIPGYDSLSASQVVQRLGGLSREELEDVREHELSNRHRRTILNRVDQLLAGAGTAERP
jgi:hypothetical protein